VLLVSVRTLVAVLLILLLANYGAGYPLPFDTGSIVSFVADVTLFTGYLYLARTLLRLPIAAAITIRQARQSRARRGMSRWESILDGFYRGFLDRRRWTVGQLARLDRLGLLMIVLLSVNPAIGALLVKIGGLIGLALMLVVYLISGAYSFLLDDSPDGTNRVPLPFLNIRRRE